MARKARISIVTPARPGTRNGNRHTAGRWAGFLRGAGHRVAVRTQWEGEPCDVLLALHAARSHASVLAFRERHPDRPLVVVLTGTDLYRDLPHSREARQSLELANRIVVLQSDAKRKLVEKFQRKTCVVYQSADPALRHAPPKGRFRIAVIGHLRKEKDPFRTALALQHLHPDLEVVQVGDALSPEMKTQARKLMKRDARYRWLGGRSHRQALGWIARSHLLVVSSVMEGGANVICEAARIGTPVLASRVSGNIGMLGRDYPGYYPLFDEKALARLIEKCILKKKFIGRLKRALAARRHLFAPAAERRALRDALRMRKWPMKREPRPGLPAEQATFRSFDAIIDVRSPAEYAEDHVPGALSCPVLDNDERARVGTIYKQTSPYEAKKIGAALVARNIAGHLETSLADKPRGWKPLVYCWRGGQRSAAMAHVLREVGWDAMTLQGGYKAYRRYVVASLAQLPQQFNFRVIHGVTGSGKSRLLRALAGAGAQVLDLEDLAAHRGSVLGNLPGRPQPSQKMFESLLLKTLLNLDHSKEIFVEGESKKIGQLQVPDALIARMRASECVLLDTSADARVALLMDEYRHFFSALPALNAQLDCLVALHGRERVGDWKALAATGKWQELVARLLAEHYDPAYKRSAPSNFPRLADAKVIRVDSADEATFATLAGQLTISRLAPSVA